MGNAATKVAQVAMAYEQGMKSAFEMTLTFMTIEELREIAGDYRAIVDGKPNTAGPILPPALDARVWLQVISDVLMATDYVAWVEHVDPPGIMQEDEFNVLTVAEKIQLIRENRGDV
jgi:hypothetical protein